MDKKNIFDRFSLRFSSDFEVFRPTNILIRLGLIPNRDISPIPDTRKIFDYLELSIKNCIFALENR